MGKTKGEIIDEIMGIGGYDYEGNRQEEMKKYVLNIDDFEIDGSILEGYNGNDQYVTIPEFIVAIGGISFIEKINLKGLLIPNSVTAFGPGAFLACESLTKIIFLGTKEEWNSINKMNGWNKNTPEIEVLCDDGTIFEFAS